MKPDCDVEDSEEGTDVISRHLRTGDWEVLEKTIMRRLRAVHHRGVTIPIPPSRRMIVGCETQPLREPDCTGKE